MHEFSLALNIVKIAESEAEKAKAHSIRSIDLEIGECAGVEMRSFEFAWPLAIKDTLLENAEMRVNAIKGKARCKTCNSDFEIHELYDPCPECGSFLKNIYQGKEFRVASITII